MCVSSNIAQRITESNEYLAVCLEKEEEEEGQATDLSPLLEDLHPWESPPRAERPDAPILPPIMAELLPKLPLLSLTPPPVLHESPPLLPRPLPLYLQTPPASLSNTAHARHSSHHYKGLSLSTGECSLPASALCTSRLMLALNIEGIS